MCVRLYIAIGNFESCRATEYGRSGFNCEYLYINCELRVFVRFTINRFTNINVYVYYNTVYGVVYRNYWIRYLA